ncbi:MAG: acylphosphatase [Bacteroidetes bacterium HGW-Bacteroidetes-9]|jgi:acylphosphatase|nr:MAG: acylphosphatase [Bacteroidetes bacterium HGW-Bacteroidetes-9]
MNIVNEIIQVNGRVQGVGFRYATQSTAISLGLNGYVCNKPDGSVYIEVEGTKEQIAVFIVWCKKGPSRAIVQEVRHFSGPLMNYQSFRIR